MKAIYFLLIPLVLIGCQRTNGKKKLSLNDSINIQQSKHVDTVFIDKSKGIVPDWIYLDMDSLTTGAPFDDLNGNYGFYRIIFTISEETKSLFCEKITIVGDGKAKIDKRIQLPEDIAGNKDFTYNKFLGWKSPEIIELKVYRENEDKIVYINLSTQKFISLK